MSRYGFAAFGERAIPYLMEILDQSQPEKTLVALSALEYMGEKIQPYSDTFVTLMLNSPNDDIRDYSISILWCAKGDTVKVIPAYIEVLRRNWGDSIGGKAARGLLIPHFPAIR